MQSDVAMDIWHNVSRQTSDNDDDLSVMSVDVAEILKVVYQRAMAKEFERSGSNKFSYLMHLYPEYYRHC